MILHFSVFRQDAIYPLINIKLLSVEFAYRDYNVIVVFLRDMYYHMYMYVYTWSLC